MSAVMRWRSGLMGLSSIAKAPVSHGVEPHDLETGPGLRLQPSSPRLPRERFSPWVDSGRLVADPAGYQVSDSIPLGTVLHVLRTRSNTANSHPGRTFGGAKEGLNSQQPRLLPSLRARPQQSGP